MNSPGPQDPAGGARHSFQNLHPSVWTRLSALCSPESKGPAEVLLYGPMGVGKTALLRRAYWEMFERQDAETPLFFSIPPVPFHPALWARRFLMETAWQCAAFDRRNENMARSLFPPLPILIDLCYDARLQPLAEVLEYFGRFENAPSDDAFLLEWAFDAVAHAAERMDRRLTLLIDNAEFGFWAEGGIERHLSLEIPAAQEDGPVRRVWTLRQGASENHPYQTPPPPAREHWEVQPMAAQAAAEFFDRRCNEAGVDYDRHVLKDYLALWGHIPRWLDNFVRQAGENPRSLVAPDHFIQSYSADLLNGPTARDLQDALRMAVPGGRYDPALLARVAGARLRWEEGGAPSGPVEEKEDLALRRLARTGLALYEQGRWIPSRVPVLEDFLRLFIARHQRRSDLLRSEIALKRRRLIETPLRIGEQRREQKIRHVSMLMHTFREQSVPAGLFQRHLDRLPGKSASAADPAAVSAHEEAEALDLIASAGENRIRVPYCIGAFSHHSSFPSRGQKSAPIPTVVASCFETSECLRSEESLWVAFLCDASVVTSEEMNEMERTHRQIGRELRVGRGTGWLITDGDFSPEALERIRKLAFYVSNWRDCEILGDLLMRGSHAANAEAIVPDASQAGAAETPAPQASARIVSAGKDSAGERVADIFLSPHADMELVAAGAVEQVAAACGFDKTAISQMRMAVLEACLNAFEHSRNSEKRVRLRIEGGPARCVIVVENEGATFDPQAVKEPVLEEKMGDPYKRGWGLMLMRKFMDRVVYEPWEGGTRLRMEKRKRADASNPENRAASDRV